MSPNLLIMQIPLQICWGYSAPDWDGHSHHLQAFTMWSLLSFSWLKIETSWSVCLSSLSVYPLLEVMTQDWSDGDSPSSFLISYLASPLPQLQWLKQNRDQWSNIHSAPLFFSSQCLGNRSLYIQHRPHPRHRQWLSQEEKPKEEERRYG